MLLQTALPVLASLLLPSLSLLLLSLLLLSLLLLLLLLAMKPGKTLLRLPFASAVLLMLLLLVAVIVASSAACARSLNTVIGKAECAFTLIACLLTQMVNFTLCCPYHAIDKSSWKRFVRAFFGLLVVVFLCLTCACSTLVQQADCSFHQWAQCAGFEHIIQHPDYVRLMADQDYC